MCILPPLVLSFSLLTPLHMLLFPQLVIGFSESTLISSEPFLTVLKVVPASWWLYSYCITLFICIRVLFAI